MKNLARNLAFAVVAIAAAVFFQLNFNTRAESKDLALGDLIQKAEACPDLGGYRCCSGFS